MIVKLPDLGFFDVSTYPMYVYFFEFFTLNDNIYVYYEDYDITIWYVRMLSLCQPYLDNMLTLILFLSLSLEPVWLYMKVEGQS